MKSLAGVTRGLDRLLNIALELVLILALLYGSYALWDTYLVFNNASARKMLTYKPDLLTADGANPTLADLALINPDIRAWLTLDDTSVDYPVLQYTDNFKYVDTDAYGGYSLSGSIFMDYNCAADFSDPYSLLYGHHMDAGKMFGALDGYLEKKFFQEHQSGTLFLPDKTYKIEIFAAMSVDAYDHIVFSPGGISEEGSRALLKHIVEKATWYRDIGVSDTDMILAMSTCADAETNGRTVVYGRLTQMKFEQQGE